ncbi:hypothetical protein C2S51_002283 [Perilla frutescens var. frutescens]|nr:hypothetical protein C2S51_002283 [Perilla frutescens var. frutescens]
MSSSSDCKKKSNVNFMACTKYKAKKDSKKSTKNFAFCSYIVEDSDDEDKPPSRKDAKGKGKEAKVEVARVSIQTKKEELVCGNDKIKE